MSIGETLAQARRGAGLSVTEVSQRTRIRETLVKGIERDDYSGCGGDFYTRGHIRAIARVVGTDPEPLIEEYDTARRESPAEPVAGAAQQYTAASKGSWQQREPPTEPLAAIRQHVPPASPRGRQEPQRPQGPPPTGPLTGLGQRVPPAWTRRRTRRNWPVLFGLVLVVTLGFLGYYFVSGPGQAPTGTPAAGNHTAGSGPGRAAQAHGGAAHPARTVTVRLTAIRASTVEFTTPGGRYLFRATIAAGASKKWTFRHAVNMRLGNPGGVRLVVDGKNPLPHGSAARPVTLTLSPGHPATVATPAGTPGPAATPSPAVPLTTSVPLSPASAVAFGVSGPGLGDNPQLAPLAIDGNRSTAWNTDWYASARFGNLYPGTGLLLDMGRPVTITSAQIILGSAPGASFQLRVGSAPALADLPAVAHAAGASGVVRLRLTTPAHGRYVLIWFTRLPLNPDGNFEASVYDVRLDGRA